MNRLKDLRTSITSLDQAKIAFAVLAHLELQLAKADAQFEARIAKLKKEHHEKTLPEMQTHQRAAEDLTAYIETHPDEFKNPRKIKIDMGTFGLQTVTEVEITDAVACLRHVAAAKLADCFKEEPKLLKAGLQAHLTAGETLPGCSLKTGDTAVYKVSKVLLDEARTIEE
jgi:hypothetical protein